MVQSDDLRRFLPLLGAVSIGDERGVSARLEALETSHRKDIGELKRIVLATNVGSFRARLEVLETSHIAMGHRTG